VYVIITITTTITITITITVAYGTIAVTCNTVIVT
jgi:hypothetical protein